MSKVSGLLKQAALTISDMQTELNQFKEKIAFMESSKEREKRVRDQLVKMASIGEIDYSEIEDKVEEMLQKDDRDFEIEMGVMQKLASNNYLNIGGLRDKKETYGDPLTDFIVSYSGSHQYDY